MFPKTSYVFAQYFILLNFNNKHMMVEFEWIKALCFSCPHMYEWKQIYTCNKIKISYVPAAFFIALMILTLKKKSELFKKYTNVCINTYVFNIVCIDVVFG